MEPVLTENAHKVLAARYLIKNSKSEVIETPMGLFHRVAKAIAMPEIPSDRDRWANIFYTMMARCDFEPNTPCLVNAGKPGGTGQLSACFVLPVPDSIDGIFEALKQMAAVHKSGGGTGFSFSRLRPGGSFVKTTTGIASGPVSFMQPFNYATETLKQGGVRRGANMGILRCLAPDTLVHTLEGKKRICDLVGQRPYVYACDPTTKRVHVVQADKVFISDRNRRLVRVWFDNDDYLDCTPDHLMMRSSGDYRQAGQLVQGDSLMAFDKRIVKHGSDRYEKSISCTGGRADLEHRQVARDIFGEEVGPDWHVHHIDEDTMHNDPSNLQMTSRSDHATEHVANLLENQTRIAAKRKGRTLEETYGKEKADEWKAKMRKAKEKTPGNHKVVRVEEIHIADNVYDISLPRLHNFVANGVFVHNCDHPDILEFIRMKLDATKMQNFNVSVAITDKFMAALDANDSYDLVNPATGLAVDSLAARTVWDEIVRCAWTIGDPGLFFIDRVNDLDPLSKTLGEIEATNPCGEVPLRAHDACTLGSINLSNFYVRKADGQGTIDFTRLGATVRCATRFLDNVLSVGEYPVPQIYEVTRASRKIGLGAMGWADLLMKLGIPYESKQAQNLGEQVMEFISNEAIATSEELAVERGAFPAWPGSLWDVEGHTPRRNATITVIAPTGSISIIAGCSSGIEPTYALSITRTQASMTMTEVNPIVEQIAREHGFWSDELAEIVKRTGSVQTAPGIPDHWRQVFKIANEIDVPGHIMMQAAFQRHVEDGVSKTINMANSATLQDVESAYALAWEQGCKGITIYRDGCRTGQVLVAGTTALVPVDTVPTVNAVLANVERRKIPPNGRRHGVTLSKTTPYGTAHVTINEHPDDAEPFEVFVRIGKSGSEVMAWTEAFGRAVSYMLSIPSPISPRGRLDAVASQMASIGGGGSIGFGENQVVSAPDAIAKVLLDYLNPPGSDTAVPSPTRAVRRDMCPQCGQATLTYEQRCGICSACGFSKC